MRYETQLMRTVLTDETARQMIDWVSWLYGESYVALWVFQVIGAGLTDPAGLAEDLRSETSPATASRLLDQWETHFGRTPERSLSDETRRARLMLQTQLGDACNPANLARAVSNALGCAEVEIEERTGGPYRFTVHIRDSVPSIVPAVRVLEQRKPAHLNYDIDLCARMVSETELRTAVALVYAETVRLEVSQ